MSEDKSKDGKPQDDERTVFMAPGSLSGGTVPSGPGGAPAPPPAGDKQVTTPPGTVVQTNFMTAFAPRTDGQAIQIGDVLNHIFEVRRFIARGGMGEVFEGVNVNTDERVAIKVMLPALAADPNVIAMFRKEARTLTRLHHEALVQYRVLAQEPQLGVLYIVTEYVDGVNLADVLGKSQPTAQELKQLLAKLASGLRVAHALGAVHRDMSPDNVLLENGELGGAKIIDFGIAKDLDPSSKTIIGDGFAGKLNYVAPEQLGDFGREVGPWTDVYSLGLVILAVAMGKNVQMGGSLVDAVDKRRAGPDLSPAPDEIRPVLEKMLKANPQERLRSMDDVLTELGVGTQFAPGGEGGAGVQQRGPSKGVLVGGGIAAVALIGALGWFALGPGAGPKGDPVQLATTAVNQVLPTVECSWLDIAKIERGEPLSVRVTGVAGNPSAAQNQVAQALQTAGVSGASVNFDEVALIRPQGCSALQTLGRVRTTGARHMTVPQREFEMMKQPAGSQYPVASRAVITFTPQPGKEFSLFGIEPEGMFSQLVASKEELDKLVASEAAYKPEERLAEKVGDSYRIRPALDHTGWSGIVLLTGDGPFDPKLTQPAPAARNDTWQTDFVATASEREWKSEMLWFKSVNKNPND